MRTRFKELRNHFELTQEEFAEKTGLSRSYVNLIEMGKKIPAERTLRDICRIFSIREQWLINGIEPMELPEEDEEAAYVSELLEDSDNDFYDLIKAFMKTYCESGEKEKQILKSFAKDLKSNLKKESQD